MKKSPKEIQDFLKLRWAGNFCYSDKTRFVVELLKSGKSYFLSRPRRFGKNLFLDTLRQAFLAKKIPFKDSTSKTTETGTKKRRKYHAQNKLESHLQAHGNVEETLRCSYFN